MAENYSFNLPSLEIAADIHEQALEQIRSVYSNANQILNEIQSNTIWQGKQRDEFEAFLTLLVSYHGDLIGEQNHQSHGHDPYQKLVDGLKQLNGNLSGYTGGSSSYKELESL